MIATLGRFEGLQASGQLERLLRSGARFAAKAMMLSAASDDAAIKIAVRRIGPGLVFERLWEETGCRAVIADLAGARGHKFALERAVFLTVLHRLFMSGSDRAADRWREDYAITGIEELDLHHLYRAMAWLGEELPEKEQDGRTPFSPRCLKDMVEERLSTGSFVLRTNTDLNPLETMLCYKHLSTVEQTFRTAKHLLATRPIFHKLDETIRGHVFCSFLALVLKKALEDRIAAFGRSGSWPQIIADLDSLTETEIEQDGKHFVVRSRATCRRQPRPAGRRRRVATDRARSRQLTADTTRYQNVVPSRRRGADYDCLSITW